MAAVHDHEIEDDDNEHEKIIINLEVLSSDDEHEGGGDTIFNPPIFIAPLFYL